MVKTSKMRKKLLILFLLVSCLAKAQFPKLEWPLEGTLNKDFFIVNYVDHDTVKGKIKDYNCGIQTYDGHQGTDIVLKGFHEMDSGVNVLASAKGKVVEVVQNQYDRNKTSVISRGFGNYIGVDHGNGVYIYYAHIKKNSAMVKIGDSLFVKQKIAKVGCAGNCTDPHLHFEIWYNYYTLIDPFNGTCNKGKSLWKSQPIYNDSFGIINQGLIPFVGFLDTLKETLPTPSYFDTSSTKTSAITYWNLSYGIKTGDSSYVVWLSPGGKYYYSYGFKHTYPSRYYYFWTYINTPKIIGKWKAQYYLNNQLKAEKEFMVGTSTNIGSEKIDNKLDLIEIMDNHKQDFIIEVYDISGKLILQNPNLQELSQFKGLKIIKSTEIKTRNVSFNKWYN